MLNDTAVKDTFENDTFRMTLSEYHFQNNTPVNDTFQNDTFQNFTTIYGTFQDDFFQNDTFRMTLSE